jgi:O-antigen ligase
MTVSDVPANRNARSLTRAVWVALLVAVALTPVLVDHAGRDVYRVPKRVFFQAAMLAVGALMTAGALLWDDVGRLLARNRRAVLFAAVTLLWTAIVSMTAVVPDASRSGVLTVFCHALLFVTAVALARMGNPSLALAALLVPALLNAWFVGRQAWIMWQPFVPDEYRGTRTNVVGLIGNPNTVGTYLLIPALAAFVGAVTMRRYRLPLGATAAVLLASIFLTQTITVGVGVAAAVLAFVLTAPGRARAIAAVVLVAGITAVSVYAPTRARIEQLLEMARQGDYSAATSARLPASAVALDMLRERPLTGVGPGGYAARYMPYRTAIEERYPEWIQVTRESFGEAHNDHAQVLAETGLPGYALFLGFLVAVARMTFRRAPDASDERARFARMFAFPAAAGFGAVALGQFPLELAAVSSSATFAAALCFAWSEDAGA